MDLMRETAPGAVGDRKAITNITARGLLGGGQSGSQHGGWGISGLEHGGSQVPQRGLSGNLALAVFIETSFITGMS